MKKLVSILSLTLFLTTALFGQTQVGSDINGEAAGDKSGNSVTMDSDGSHVAIGASRNDGTGSNAGHVRVYQYSGSTWSQVGSDIDGEAANDYSGTSIAMDSDGSHVAIGAFGNDGNGSMAGHVRIFKYSGGTRSQVGSDIDGEAASDFSGYSVAMDSDGSHVAIGAYNNDGTGSNAGHARVYEYRGSSWSQVGSDIDGEAVGDNSGWWIAMDSDGSHVAIGAGNNDGAGTNAGHVRVYKLNSSPSVTALSNISTNSTSSQAVSVTGTDTDTEILAITASSSNTSVVTVADATNESLSGNNTTGTITLTNGGTEGTATITVTVTDAANATASTTFDYTYDGTAPTMTITATDGSNAVSSGSTTNDGTLTLTFTASEATTDFVVGDITVTNGSLSSFSATSSTVYTATFTPTTNGAVTVDVAGSTFTDAAGNNNSAATQYTWTYDGTAPTASLAYTVSGSSVTAVKQSDAVTITATFNENIADSPVMQISGSGVETVAAANMTKVSTTSYTYAWTAPAGDGTQTWALATGKDVAGNGVTTTPTSGATITVDNTAPTMTITAANSSSTSVSSGSTTNDGTLTLTFTSSEATTDFVVGDITVTNGALSNFSATSSTVYTATFTPTSDGAATVNVAGSTFTDAAGNNNSAATQYAWTYDGTFPTMTITATDGSNAVSSGSTTNDGTLTLTFTAGEATSDFAVGDITVTNGSLSSFSATSSTVYTATFTPTTNSAVTIDVAGSTFTDATGNNNTAATQFNWTYDNTGPTVTFSPAIGATGVALASNITITFNEAVRNTDDSALTDTNVDALITLNDTDASGVDIAFDATVNTEKTIITINPTSDFSFSQAIYVAIGATLEDISNNPINAASVTITTVANSLPVATAQTVSATEDVDVAITLSGSDNDNHPLTLMIATLPAAGTLYQTTDGTTKGDAITAVPTTVTSSSFKVIYISAENGNGDGYGNFGFKANDGFADGTEATVTVNVTAVNDMPTANAGFDQTVYQGTVLPLNGSGSHDPDGTSLTFNWNAPQGVTLSSLTAERPTFTAPDVSADSLIMFTLTVNDGEVNSAADTVMITVFPIVFLDLPSFVDSPQSVGTTPVEISITLQDSFLVDTISLHYIQGGNGNFSGLPMTAAAGAANGYTLDIPAEALSEGGLAYYVNAVDVYTNTIISDTFNIPVKYPGNVITSRMGASPFKEGFPIRKWRIISIPTELDDPGVTTIFDTVFETDPGEQTWKLYEWTASDWAYATEVTPGKAYWLHQWVADTVNFTTGTGVSVDLTGTTISALPGWNIFSSPYPFGVNVSLDADVFAGPYTYGDFSGEGWGTDVTQLAPWSGYAVYNWGDSPQTFDLRPLDQLGSLGKRGKESMASNGWRLKLAVTGNTYSDQANYIGQLTDAEDQRDGYDLPEPPYIEGYISLSMARPDWGEKVTRFTSDMRSPTEDVAVWDINLRTQGETGPITLAAELWGDYPSGHEIWLLDVVTKAATNLLKSSEMVITAYHEKIPNRYKVISGPADRVQMMIDEVLGQLPESFSLSQNYPNPFNPITTIRYELREPSQVHLLIYDLLGREVKTLVNEAQDMGARSIRWDGRNAQGLNVSAGIYFYRISMQSLSGNTRFTKMKKMVLLK